MFEQMKTWAKSVKRDILVLYLAGRDPRVPWYAKALAVVAVGYALSPIDLIPDFIPVIGYLDDLIILPVAIIIAVRLIPHDVVVELREEAARQLATRLPKSRRAAFAIIAIWVLLGVLAAMALITDMPPPPD